MIGTKLAHYEITSHLGSGGMGDVYQARDLKLGRSVAIKLLPEAFALDAERVARFEREARVLASLNHPNIAALYGVEEANGRSFLVMELVPGETLADAIRRGPIPCDEALGIATQIADALESAHEKGVVHRDLKPANVKVTREGKVKVLDFGLAKAFEPETANVSLSNSPTLSMAATQHGVILGTAAYMAPEQAKGRQVDRRSDIFAFGCVLYEMLSGRPAFAGEDVTEILARVVTAEPDWSRLPQATPAAIQRLLWRALKKDPRQRLGDIRDARFEIEEALAAPASEPANAAVQPQPITPPRRFRWAVPGAIGLVLGAAVVLWSPWRTPPEEPPVVFDILPGKGESFGVDHPGISPDGRSVALQVRGPNGSTQLAVRQLGSLETKILSGDLTQGTYPAWSPDGRSLVFAAGGKLRRIEVAGGPAQTLCDSNFGSIPFPAWGPSGVILFPGPSGELLRVSEKGGTPQKATTLRCVTAGKAARDSAVSAGWEALPVLRAEHRQLKECDFREFAG